MCKTPKCRKKSEFFVHFDNIFSGKIIHLFTNKKGKRVKDIYSFAFVFVKIGIKPPKITIKCRFLNVKTSYIYKLTNEKEGASNWKKEGTVTVLVGKIAKNAFVGWKFFAFLRLTICNKYDMIVE